jgi:hypothetical protein
MDNAKVVLKAFSKSQIKKSKPSQHVLRRTNPIPEAQNKPDPKFL